MYLGRDDVQYVDLRNFDDKMESGYIAGFEFIPFFDYLEGEGYLVEKLDGARDWVFAASDIKTGGAAVLEGLFDDSKTIFLMCGSGTRAGYVMAALESLGYENVINVGGISNYTGDNKVLGDGSFTLNPLPTGIYTPGVYTGELNGYLATVVIGAKGAIVAVSFDAISCSEIKVDGASQDPKEYSSCTTKQTLGLDYGLIAYGGATLEWFQQADLVADAVLAAQGWSTAWTLVEDGSHMKFNGTDGVSGVTIGVEGFQGSLAAALLAATPAS
jgi:rhodanese-related sulfurtransferase